MSSTIEAAVFFFDIATLPPSPPSSRSPPGPKSSCTDSCVLARFFADSRAPANEAIAAAEAPRAPPAQQRSGFAAVGHETDHVIRRR